MSTDLVTTNVKLPSHLAGRVGVPSSLTESMTSGISGGGLKRVSIRGGRFRIREGSTETVLPEPKLRCVIVGANPNMTKLFYKGTYNPKATDNDKKPDCYSDDGIRPAKDAEDPQAQLCASCEHNAWGSKVSDSGQQMKACADQKRLAIISASDNSDEPDVFLFTVPPSSLTEFRNYGKLLESKGLPPEICVTEIYFDPQTSHPRPLFKFVDFVDESMVPVIDSLVGSTKVREVTGAIPHTAKVVEAPKKPSLVHVEEAEVEVIVPEVIKPAKKSNAFDGEVLTAKIVEEPVKPAEAKTAASSDLEVDIQSIIASLQEDNDDE